MNNVAGILGRWHVEDHSEDPHELELSAKKVLEWLTGKSDVNPATEYVLHCIRIWPSNTLYDPLDEDDDD